MGLEFEYRNQRDTLTTHHVRRAGSITYPYITLLSTVYPFDRPGRPAAAAARNQYHGLHSKVARKQLEDS
ncbi:hypothetical protein NC653_030760 [Populus alba x Populus x berolinensis]|uniref:Uncharacterized protein n=1 Tax=Populus alba x Populus x berolinensis TaxID=444605 RepID=A0AAD6LX29_9ROSI|nr:hypothetical protein NC653_030760 [Populus alba x Populus x berolinensis]